MNPARWALILGFGLACSLPLGLAADNDDVKPDEAAPAPANLFNAPLRLAAADGVMDSGSSWGHSSPWVTDIDGDGRKDLIVGDFSGFFRCYRNEGSNESPRYAKAVNLKAGGVDAQVPIY